jgi:hypothetical protein
MESRRPVNSDVRLLSNGERKMKLIFVLAALLLVLPHQNRSSDLHARADVPTVDYCELLREPASYDKKVIRVKALYVAGLEVAAFEHASCDKERSTWVEFDKSESSCTEKKVSKAFDAIFHPPRKKQKGVYEIPGPFRAELVAVCRFEGPKPGIRVGSEGQRILTGHGHMSAYKYKFVVQCLEEVKAAPWEQSN